MFVATRSVAVNIRGGGAEDDVDHDVVCAACHVGRLWGVGGVADRVAGGVIEKGETA